jgi:3-hydroxyisobutyrate dehydrogenase-like beta-hydroxyacid dehydrogenase
MDVGFIGTGQMGAGMVASLLKAGHAVTVYNRSPAKTAPLVSLGARAAASIAVACDREAVFSMVADDQALESVTLGERGILASLPSASVHISCSTVSVSLSERLSVAHQAAARGFVAAPVFGRPDAAAAGKLFVVAAGPAAAVERVSPVLAAIGQRTFVISDKAPLANLLKLSGNFLIAATIEIIGEAVALANKGGIERHQYLDILGSTLFGSPVFKTYGALIAERKFEPAGFAARLGQKDVRLTMQAAEALAVPMPMAGVLRDRFLSLAAHGREDIDWAAIGYLAAVDAGAEYP